jgi:hypothetical protein
VNHRRRTPQQARRGEDDTAQQTLTHGPTPDGAEVADRRQQLSNVKSFDLQDSGPSRTMCEATNRAEHVPQMSQEGKEPQKSDSVTQGLSLSVSRHREGNCREEGHIAGGRPDLTRKCRTSSRRSSGWRCRCGLRRNCTRRRRRGRPTRHSVGSANHHRRGRSSGSTDRRPYSSGSRRGT